MKLEHFKVLYFFLDFYGDVSQGYKLAVGGN